MTVKRAIDVGTSSIAAAAGILWAVPDSVGDGAALWTVAVALGIGLGLSLRMPR